MPALAKVNPSPQMRGTERDSNRSRIFKTGSLKKNFCFQLVLQIIVSLKPVYDWNPHKEKQSYEPRQKILQLFSVSNSAYCFVKESEIALTQRIKGAFAEAVTTLAKHCRELTAELALWDEGGRPA